MTRPVIYEYSDFRLYLRDMQSYLQEQDPQFTRAEATRRAGLPNTRSFFSDVLKGRRLTATFIDRFVDVFAMSREEARFFRALVQYNQAHNADERTLFLEQLVALNRTPQRSKHPVNPSCPPAGFEPFSC